MSPLADVAHLFLTSCPSDLTPHTWQVLNLDSFFLFNYGLNFLKFVSSPSPPGDDDGGDSTSLELPGRHLDLLHQACLHRCPVRAPAQAPGGFRAGSAGRSWEGLGWPGSYFS